MDGIITGDQSSKWQKNLNGAATIGFRRTMGANKTFQQKGDRGRILGELIRAAPRLGYEGASLCDMRRGRNCAIYRS
jgi:hypothetical protein